MNPDSFPHWPWRSILYLRKGTMSLGAFRALSSGLPRFFFSRHRLPALLGLLLLLLGLEGFGVYLAGRPIRSSASVAMDQDPAGLAKTRARLQKKLAGLAPQGLYVVIDTAHNRVYLRKGEQNLAEMLASCGSGNVLQDPSGERTWVFETPRGVFNVRSKVNDPIWFKPDWAYIEEGEKIPEKRSERAMRGMLGDHAVGIGQGYFIHGTLYKRLLGRNVSHGCVRLGDEDLKAFVKAVPLGTPVVIF